MQMKQTTMTNNKYSQASYENDKNAYTTPSPVGIFVGMTNMDYVYYTDTYPEPNTKIRTEEYQRYIGGPAANAAITYALLGGNAMLFTCLGNSTEAILLKNELGEYGVNVVDCATDDAMPNISTIVIDKNGNRTIFSGQTVYRHTEGMDRYGLPINAAFALFDLNQQEIALTMLNKMPCEIVLDAGSWKPNADEFLKRAAVVISSEKFVNPQGNNALDMSECTHALTAVTRGEKSILTKTGSINVPKVECIDSLAAGDIFHGAFCYGYYIEKMQFDAALAWAASIASESVRYVGPREWCKKMHTQPRPL